MKKNQFAFLLIFTCQIIFAQKELSIKPTNYDIYIDGIEEIAWQDGDSAQYFIQLEPNPNKPSTRKTIVKALISDKNLYFLLKCYIYNKDEIKANIQRRDNLDNRDDLVSILIDTYNDKRTALLFQINPIATLSDAKISDDGKTIDFLWDAEWKGKVKIYQNLWQAEVQIPLDNIQFNKSSKTWGINFSRSIRSSQEICWWNPVTDNYRVSQSGKLTGLNIESKYKQNLKIFPYATARFENLDQNEDNSNIDFDGGVDAEYKYSSNIKLNVTVNPDFATIEGDKEQINLTPWELQFPEKRMFFQDGNELFKTRIKTFYSRRIGDIKYGAKAIGKVGSYQFNGLFSNTYKDQSLGLNSDTYTAFKVKRDILNSSSLGFTYTDKNTDSTTYRTFSLDYILNLGKTWKLTGQYVATTPGEFFNSSIWFLRFAKENNIYHYHIRYTDIGKSVKNNLNQTGYLNDDDRREVDADISYKFWMNSQFSYIRFLTKNNFYWSQSGIFKSQVLQYLARFYLMNGISLDLNYSNEYKLFDEKFYNHYYQAILGYNTDESSNIQLSYRFGKNYGLDFNLIELKTTFTILSNMSINYQFNRLKYSPDPDSKSTTLNVLGADYFFNNDTWIRVFTQNNSRNNHFYFYGLFGWRFKPPFGALYFIFNFDKYEIIDEYNYQKNNILFLKLTYPISII